MVNVERLASRGIIKDFPVGRKRLFLGRRRKVLLLFFDPVRRRIPLSLSCYMIRVENPATLGVLALHPALRCSWIATHFLTACLFFVYVLL
jgi:hypothetical protein